MEVEIKKGIALPSPALVGQVLPTQNNVFYLLAGGCLLLGFLFRLHGIGMTCVTSVLGTPLADDAYYYFSLARNIALGNGVVVTPASGITNGFQPLWGFMLAALYKLLPNADSGEFIYYAQFIGAVVGVVSGALLYSLALRISQNQHLACFVLAIYCFSPQIVKHNINAMETSLALLGGIVIYASCLSLWSHQPTIPRAFLLGSLGGFAVLARVDNIFLVCLAGFLLFKNAIDRRENGRLAAEMVTVAMFLMGFLLPLLPWGGFGSLTGCGVIPESGRAVRTISLLGHGLPPVAPIDGLLQYPEMFLRFYWMNALEFTASWVRQIPLLLPLVIPLFVYVSLQKFIIITGLFGVILSAVLYKHCRRSSERLGQAIIGWIVYTAMMTVGYSTYSHGQWFYDRYSVTIAVLFSMLLILSLVVQLKSKIYCFALILIGSMIIVGYGVLLTYGSYRWLFAGAAAVPDDGFYRTTQYLDNSLPEGSRIGVFQAGLIGYYSNQQILAIDGKVNRLAGKAILEGRMFDYFCEAKIGYVADWQDLIDRFLFKRSGDRNPDLQLLNQVSVPGIADINIYQFNLDACN